MIRLGGGGGGGGGLLHHRFGEIGGVHEFCQKNKVTALGSADAISISVIYL